MIKTPQAGQHIRCTRGAYYHHGICVGDDQVIHFNGHPSDIIKRDDNAAVEQTDLKGFKEGFPFLQASTTEALFDVPTIISRAQSWLGKHGYDLVDNNCEHFCRWVTHDEHKSAQVDKALNIVSSMVATGAMAAAAVDMAKKSVMDSTSTLLNETKKSIGETLEETKHTLDEAKKKLEASTEGLRKEAQSNFDEVLSVSK